MLPLRIIFSIVFLYFCLFYKIAIESICNILSYSHSYGHLKPISWTLGINLLFGAFAAYFIFKKRAGMDDKRRSAYVTGAAVFFGLYVMSIIFVAVSLPHA